MKVFTIVTTDERTGRKSYRKVRANTKQEAMRKSMESYRNKGYEVTPHSRAAKRIAKQVPTELTTGDAIVAFDPFHAPDWGWTP